MLSIIARNIQHRLSKKVKGTVSCHAIGSCIIVCDIICNGNIFRYHEKYTDDELVYGISSSDIADKILYSYMLDIKKKYFK